MCMHVYSGLGYIIFCTRCCDGGGVALSARAHNGMTIVRFVTVYECLSVRENRNNGRRTIAAVLAFRRGVRACVLQEVHEISTI